MGVPEGIREVAELQAGVVSRQQLLAAGVTQRVIARRLKHGNWQQLNRGVYALFTGSPGRPAWLWAAVLRAGPGAVISHATAAELHKLIDVPAEAIHVTVPSTRRTEARGVVVHISARVDLASHPRRYPPRTNIEETVLDLTQSARTFDNACGWITAAFGRGLTTTEKLREAMSARKKMRWRAGLQEILAAGDKIHSVLEYRYHRDVESAHGLPPSVHQHPAIVDGKKVYRDVYYEEYHVAVELDGRVAHPSEQHGRDTHRDVVTSADGVETVRYDWQAVRYRACETAVLQARILRQHGWTGVPTPCSRDCPVSRAFARAA
jgi:predicted transcriptional regulator of viral defense system